VGVVALRPLRPRRAGGPSRYGPGRTNLRAALRGATARSASRSTA